MGRRYETVTFVSDLGARDERAGVVRSVLRDLAAHAVVVDLTHDIGPFDVRAGSLALARAVPYLPSGVVLAAIDPGAGGPRRAVGVEVAGGEGVFVGPDNGLLAPAVAMAGGADRCVELTETSFHLAAPGATFAARDVFAPVVAHLCNGVDLAEFGAAVDADLLTPGVVPLPQIDAAAVVCEVLSVDRFGNCQLNVGPDDIDHLGAPLRVGAGDPAAPTVRVAALVRAFGDTGVGAVGLLTDASGMISLVLDRRSAAEELAVAVGDQVTLSSLDDGDRVGLTSPVRLRRP